MLKILSIFLALYIVVSAFFGASGGGNQNTDITTHPLATTQPAQTTGATTKPKPKPTAATTKPTTATTKPTTATTATTSKPTIPTNVAGQSPNAPAEIAGKTPIINLNFENPTNTSGAMVVGPVTTIKGPYGVNAAHFGTETEASYIQITNSDAINFTTEDEFTIDFWYMLDADAKGWSNIFCKGSRNNGWYGVWLGNSDTYGVCWGGDTGNHKIGTLEKEVWHRITVIQKDGKINTYFDGTLVEEGIAAKNYTSTTDLFIGGGKTPVDGNQQFQGAIADFKIYNYALEPLAASEKIYADIDFNADGTMVDNKGKLELGVIGTPVIAETDVTHNGTTIKLPTLQANGTMSSPNVGTATFKEFTDVATATEFWNDADGFSFEAFYIARGSNTAGEAVFCSTENISNRRGGVGIAIQGNTNKPYFCAGTSSAYMSTYSAEAASTTEYVHIVTTTVVADGNITAKVYVNGVLTAEQTVAGSIYVHDLNKTFTIGGDTSNIEGTINFPNDDFSVADIKVYSVALTADEVAAIYGGIAASFGGNVPEVPDTPEHEHVPTILVGIDSTCTSAGFTEGSYCYECGEILVEQTEIPAKGHVYSNGYCVSCGVAEPDAEHTHTEVLDAAVAPTCTATGLTEGSHCSVCGEILVAQTLIPANGHSAVLDAATSPSCTATGLTEGSHCSVCGEILVEQTEIPANGHSAVLDAATSPSCTATGLTEGSHCSVCGEILVAQTLIPANGHSYENGSCTVCGAAEPTLNEKIYADIDFNADGTMVDIYGKLDLVLNGASVGETNVTHSGTTIQLPTLNITESGQEGVATFKEFDSATISDFWNDADGFAFEAFFVNRVHSGTQGIFCSTEYAGLGLALTGAGNPGLCLYYDNGTRKYNYTKGETALSTTEFTHVISTAVVKADGIHTAVYVNGVLVASNDATDGLEGVSIHVEDERYLPYATQFSIGNDIGTSKFPTTDFSIADIKVYSVALTADEVAEIYGGIAASFGGNVPEVPDTPEHTHTEVLDAAVAPTCTATGLTEGSHCSVCGEILVAQTEISANGHSYENGICTVCGAAELLLNEKIYADIDFNTDGTMVDNKGKLELGVIGTPVITETDVTHNGTTIKLPTLQANGTNVGTATFKEFTDVATASAFWNDTDGFSFEAFYICRGANTAVESVFCATERVSSTPCGVGIAMQTGGKPYFVAGLSSNSYLSVASTTPASTTEYIHVITTAVVSEGTLNAAVYVNGVLVAENTAAATINVADVNKMFVIGGDTNSNTATSGSVDLTNDDFSVADIKVYGAALTADEIAAIYGNVLANFT